MRTWKPRSCVLPALFEPYGQDVVKSWEGACRP